MKKDFSDAIASSMDATLRDPEFKSIFSTSAVLEKLAFNKTANEEVETPVEMAVEISEELTQQPLSTQASSPRADCIACGKERQGWTESMGICKCSTADGCSPLDGCKEGCSCGCKTKKAGVSMNDVLVKSAVSALLKASSDLEDAGFDRLSAYALIMTNELIAEAKSKKDSKEDKAKAKEKADKAKAKAEKDKNAAKDKAMKDKEKAKADKEKADKAKAKAKADKEKKK